MDRRTFIGSLAGLLATPLAAVAQPAPNVYWIGLLGGSPPTDPSGRFWEGFFQGLQGLGYVEGQNVLFEGRWYGEHTDRLAALAAELVQLKVDVIIVAGATPAPKAAQRATPTIPIVFTSHPDPVGSGLVSSLARPGRNVTGLASLTRELVGKQLQLLKEALPGISRVALLSNPTVPSNALLAKEAEVAARSLKVLLQVRDARAPSDFANAFSAMRKDRAGLGEDAPATPAPPVESLRSVQGNTSI